MLPQFIDNKNDMLILNFILKNKEIGKTMLKSTCKM